MIYERQLICKYLLVYQAKRYLVIQIKILNGGTTIVLR
jgi:hypothetical protein